MICRVWRGWTRREDADAYQAVIHHQVIPDIEALCLEGFQLIDLMRRDIESEHGPETEFSTFMWFSSIEAVKAFLPDGHDLAYVPEEALGLLTRFDRPAAHYEVLDHRQQPIRR